MQESGEMYLETIYVLQQKNKSVRSIDVAEYMGFSKPSVSRAVSILKDGGFIHSDNNGYLQFTDDGLSIAKKIYERHTVLSEFLMSIGVDKENATNDACKMEHIISDATFDTIKKIVNK